MAKVYGLLKIAAFLILAGVLQACNDEQPATAQTAQATQQPAGTSQNSQQKPMDPSKYQGQELSLLDISEQQIDGAGTLVLTFSVPLEASQRFADFISVSDLTAGNLIEPAWLLADKHKELHLAHLPPEHKLKITVQPGLLAINGAHLAKEQQFNLTTTAKKPMLGFASKGSLLPIELAQGLPVQSLNVEQVDVDFYRIKESALHYFVSEFSKSSFSVWANDELQKKADLVYSGRFDLQAKANVQQRTLLPIKEIKPLQQTGVYYAVMRTAGNYSYSQPATLFSLSDIGLSAHRTSQNLDIFALGIAKGKSLAGVQIWQLDKDGNELGQSVTTDNKGYAQMVLQQNATLLLAKKNQQTSFLSLKRSALDLSEFTNLQGQPQLDTQLFVFSPRDLYRPGETVYINGLLRDGDGKPLPAQPIKTKVLTPDGKELRNFVWQPVEDGFYQYQLPLAASAPTGNWRFVFELDASGKHQLQHEIQVEDFMPERMALVLKGKESPLAPTEDLLIQVEGNFLYGAPATDSQVQAQLYVRPLREAVASLPGYKFGSITENLPTQSLDFTPVVTDAQGQARLQFASQWDEASSPLELISRVSLMESGGRPITRRIAQAVWPAPQLVGIRGHYDNSQVDEDSLASFSLVMANHQGELLPAQDLQVKLIRERRDYYWSYSADSGWRSSYREKNLLQQSQQVSLDGNNPLQLDFPVEWGSYRLEVKDPKTGLVTSERFWAGYRWQDSSDDGGVRPDQVRLKLDKPAYNNGDTASVRIEAPHAGSGYLLVESSAGALWWQNIDVPAEGLDVRIPIAEDWNRHDLYITALVVRPGERSAEQTAKRAVGVLHLPLDRSARKLQIAIEASEKTRPSQDLPMRIKVLDSNGQIPANARVLVSAVDVGVLNITNFVTPDSFASFFGRKAYGVDQLDVYAQLIDASKAGMARLRFGGDAAMEQGGGRPKSHVQIVAWQSEPLQLDADGYANTNMPLPEFNGQLRLMVQAWSDDSFASDEQLTTVAAPLMSELNMPRFLARDDQTQLALELHNLTEQEQTLKLEFTADNLLRIESSPPTTLRLAANQRQVIQIPVRALNTGTAQLQLKVTGMQLPNEQLPALERSWQLDVRSAWPNQGRRVTQLLEPGESWSLPQSLLTGLNRSSLIGRISLSSSPHIGLERFVRALYEYPYGCSEQTASRLLPLLYLSAERLSELLDKPISEQERERLLQHGIDHLLSMQRSNGGFAMWRSSDREIPWNTVLATDFLQRAAERGLRVPEQSLQQARERLLRYVRESYTVNISYSDEPAHSKLAVQSYASYVLSQQQALPLSALRSLHARAADARTPLPLVHLAVALHKAGDTKRSRELLQKAGTVKRAARLWLQDYGSTLSDQAWLLYLLQEHGLLNKPELNQRLEQLLDSLHQQQWLSTQENAAVFLALNTLGLNESSNWQASMKTATGTKQLNQANRERNLSAADFSEEIQLTNDADIALYQSLNLRGEPNSYQASSNNVLSIERQFYHLDGRPAQLGKLASGELLLVHLSLNASENVQDALVVDMLPAGFELENQNLAQSSVLLSDVSAFADWGNSMRNGDIQMQSFLDDRYVAALSVNKRSNTHLLYLVRAVTPGEYQLPAVQVQSMYQPAWQAEHGGGQSVKIH